MGERVFRRVLPLSFASYCTYDLQVPERPPMVETVRAVFVALALLQDMSGRSVPLKNPGFEVPILTGWTTHVFGAQSDISLDFAAPKEGRQSLRVHAREPSDTAFSQEVTLKPSSYYRLTGWVRTRGLDPHGA